MIISISEIQKFKLSESFLDSYRGVQPNWGFGDLSYVTYKRTYARVLPDGSTEEWWQTCQRVIEGMFTVQKAHCFSINVPWNNRKAQASAQEAYERMFCFKWTPPGRGMFAMGTDFVYERGSGALLNCAFVSTKDVKDDLAEPFCWTLLMLAHGTGVGYDTLGAGTVKLQEPRRGDDAFVVEDAREGWESALRRLLSAFVGKGSIPKEWDVSGVRSKGSAINGLGGTASGPEPLLELLARVEEICLSYVGREIDSTFIVDVFNLIGKCVVSGGSRRSAMLSLGDSEDEEFMSLKADMEKLMDYRWASNNSISAEIGMDYARAAELTATNGEPGYLWLENARAYGRMIDGPDYKDMQIMGVNPCVTGDTWIHTSEGARQVSDLVGIQFEAIVEGKVFSSTEEGFWSTGVKPVYRLQTRRGYSLRLTGNHKLLRSDNTWVEVEDLNVGETLRLADQRTSTVLNSTVDHNLDKQGWLLGAALGCWDFSRDEAFFPLQEEGMPDEFVQNMTYVMDELDMDYSYGIESGWVQFLSKELVPFVKSFGLGDHWSDSFITPQIERMPDLFLHFFFEGLQEAHYFLGGADNSSLYFPSDDWTAQDLQAAQRIHLRLGKVSTIAENSALSLDDSHDPLFEDQIVSIEHVGEEEVFDATILGAHEFDANGFRAHNCGEQFLESYEACNVPDVYPIHHDSIEDFKRTLKFAYLYAKTVTLIPTHSAKTNAVMMKNRRIGLSMSGITQSMDKIGVHEFIGWMDGGYNQVQHWDEVYSDWFCVPRSIKTTTIKPGGTTGLVAGVTPGVHRLISKYHIRNVRIKDDSPIWKICQDAGYHVEDDAYAPYTKVVSFPVCVENIERGEDEVSMWEQLNNAALLQRYWSDNGVSCTVKFYPEEAKDIQRALEYYQHSLKGISFLPQSDHGYVQAPYIKITKEEYEEMMSKISPLDLSQMNTHEQDEKFCTGDRCEVTF